MKKINRKKGFTITELMIASSISLVAITALVVFYVTAQNLWMEGNAYMVLQQEARLAMEKMVRGVYDSIGIREAASIDKPNPGQTKDEVRFIDANSNERRFSFDKGADNKKNTWEDNQLTYRNESNSTSVIIDGNVVSVDFENIGGNILKITLQLRDRVRDNEINVYLSTQVSLRNN